MAHNKGKDVENFSCQVIESKIWSRAMLYIFIIRSHTASNKTIETICFSKIIIKLLLERENDLHIYHVEMHIKNSTIIAGINNTADSGND